MAVRPIMRTDTAEKVLEKLVTSDKATIVVERQIDGKMRVTSGLAKKTKQPDEWDPPIEPYDPPLVVGDQR
jgi:hypothetical protein